MKVVVIPRFLQSLLALTVVLTDLLDLVGEGDVVRLSLDGLHDYPVLSALGSIEFGVLDGPLILEHIGLFGKVDGIVLIVLVFVSERASDWDDDIAAFIFIGTVPTH